MPVPEGKREAYRELAAKMAKVFREHGANRVVEAIADDVHHGKVTDFYRAVKAEDGETVVFCFIEWPDKATRDEAWAKIMADESLKPTATCRSAASACSGAASTRLRISSTHSPALQASRRVTMTEDKLTTCLWFDKGRAARPPNSMPRPFPTAASAHAHARASDYPSGKQGDELTVEFTVLGQAFVGLNGGPNFKPNEAVSFMVFTDDQEETDRYWNAIIGNGGEESVCGWCKDRWGFSWQIIPRALTGGDSDPDRGAPSGRSTP